MIGKIKISLVKVETKDAQEIKDLLCVIYQDELKKWFDGKEGVLYIPGYNSVDMQKYHTWDDKYYKIIYEGNKLVGVILVSNTGREHGRIDRFYILPEYQGRGIGSEVLTIIQNIFNEVKYWTLDTTKFSSRNHYFYEKNGYILDEEDELERHYCKEIDKVQYNIEKDHIKLEYSNHNFRNCNFAKSDWYKSDMSESRFSNTNLCKAIIQNSNMSDSRFTNVNLCNTIIGDARMENAEICHCNLSNFYLHDINLDTVENVGLILERCNMKSSTFHDCNLKNLKIENCDLEGATINGISIEKLLECYKKECK